MVVVVAVVGDGLGGQARHGRSGERQGEQRNEDTAGAHDKGLLGSGWVRSSYGCYGCYGCYGRGARGRPAVATARAARRTATQKIPSVVR